MNTHFSLRTDGYYLKKLPHDSLYSYIKLFIEKHGNDQANNYLWIGEINASPTEIPKAIIEDCGENKEQVLFHFDDNDETEIYWYTKDGWHCMITVQNEGRSIILTRTHAQFRKESSEYEFYSFS